MIALFSAFIILVLSRMGIRYWLRDQCDEIGFTLVAKMLDCDLCLSFWLSLLISVVLVYITLDPSWFFVPIFATPLIRYIV